MLMVIHTGHFNGLLKWAHTNVSGKAALQYKGVMIKQEESKAGSGDLVGQQ